MRARARLVTTAALLAGCNALLGVDQDYTVGTHSGSGATSSTATPTGSNTGGQGGTAGGAGVGAGGTGGSGTGTAQAGSGGGSQVVYAATVADCIDTTAPDPDGCPVPAGALWIDQPTTLAFFRFEPDGTLTGATILSATLQLTVGTYPQAQGDTSGELWEVAPFARPDLYSGAPIQVGSVLVTDQGEVLPGAVVDWPLPVGLIAAGTPVFLGLYPSSYNSVGYWNLDGAAPPRLVVEYQ